MDYYWVYTADVCDGAALWWRVKPLVLTISCARDRPCHAGIGETWLKEWGHLIDHRFVLGHVCAPAKEWELVFPVEDGYGDVPKKHQEALRWAKAQGYEYVFMSDIDTYIAVPRLLRSGYEKHDFVGCRCANENHQSGAAGYWLSAKAFDPLINTDATGHSWSDMWTWHTLEKAGIHLHHDPRYACFHELIPTTEQWNDGTVTVNLGREGRFDIATMHRCHESFLRSVSCGE